MENEEKPVSISCQLDVYKWFFMNVDRFIVSGLAKAEYTKENYEKDTGRPLPEGLFD